MTAALIVTEPGLHTTVQDLGRFGYQAMGVPVAGALDPVALRLANSVVGNPQPAAALEFLYTGPTLEVAAASVRIAAAHAQIEFPGVSRGVIPSWQSVTLERGDRLRVGTPAGSACGYLAVEGGIDVLPVLGSRSTHCRSATGGLDGRALAPGDRLPLLQNAAEARGESRLGAPPNMTPPERLRVVLGPQETCFTEEALAALVTGAFRVSKQADRMGLRLDGPRLNHRGGYNIVSDGVVTGAIQVPGSGQPILLLADHQTTGGYPKIATVISADLPAAGRLKPGDPVRFVAVSVEVAEEASRRLDKSIAQQAADLVAAGPAASLDQAALYSENLVSGVVNAVE